MNIGDWVRRINIGSHFCMGALLGILLVLNSSSLMAMDADDFYCLYEDENFQGQESCYTDSNSFLGSNWSSLKVKEGYKVIVDVRSQGSSQTYSGDNASLGNGGKLITSTYSTLIRRRPGESMLL